MKPVAVPELPQEGTLLIWRAPRLVGAGFHPDDLERLRDRSVSVVVCLLEDDELERYGESLAMRQAAAAAAGMESTSLPVEDFHVPTHDQFTALYTAIDNHLGRGEAVLVHCMAGLGRAGTVAAGMLIGQGMSAPDAITLVRWVRPGAIQSQAQEDFLASLAAPKP